MRGHQAVSEHLTPSGSARYRAFLSYSHADERWASWLHRALEGYRLPRQLAGGTGRHGALPQRLFPVFRDREELASAADLPARIREALAESQALVVICSPRAASSRWVGQEIRSFKATHGEEQVYCLIVDGEPHASEVEGGAARECFPAAIRFRVGADGDLSDQAAEPLAADARPSGDGRHGALLKLLAGLLGVELDLLRRRDEQRRRRRNQGWGVAAAALIAVLSAGVWYSNAQRLEAERQRDLADTRQQIALARQLAAQSARIRVEQPAGIELASLLAIESVRRLDTLETQQALQAAQRLLPPRPVRLAEGNSNAAVRYSRDGRVALTDQGNRLGAFSVPEGRRLWEAAKHYDSKLLLTPDGCCVLFFDAGKRWQALRLDGGGEMQPPPAYLSVLQSLSPERTRRMDFSPDGRVLAAGAQRVDTATGAVLRDTAPDTEALVIFDTSGKLLARHRGRDLALFSANGAEPPKRLELAREATPRFSPDSSLLIAMGYQAMEIFDTGSGQRLFGLPCDGPMTDAAFSPDGKVLATACGNAARLHDARTGSVLADLAHDRPVNSLHFSRDGTRLLTASYDATVRIWRVADRQEVWRAAHPGYMTQAIFAPDEQSILAAGMGGIQLWPLAAQQADLLAELPGAIWSLAASPDGQWIAAAGVEPQAQVMVVRVSDGKSHQLAHPEQRVAGLAFSPDSKWLAVPQGRQLEVFPATGGEAVWRRRQGDFPYAAIVGSAFTPDGQLLVATTGKSVRGYLRLDRCTVAGTGNSDDKPCTTRELPLDPFTEAKPFFSTDGQRLAFDASVSREPTLRLWDTVGTGESILPAQKASDIVLAPDRLFVATTAGGSVDIVDLAGRKLRGIGHEGWVPHLALSPDGRYLAAGLTDPVSRAKNRVVLWRLADGEEVARYARPGDDGPLVFLPDGRRLAFSEGRGLRVVSWRAEDAVAQACTRLGRNLDCGEWRTWLRDEPYRTTCPALPATGCRP
ncbi:TIR domain-containing protein [Variovorax rhizosphaerae]|uniref:TIR domain-containing protein n=1 Tax=Variovorax rhizosphaerae TaxID=1836200 RepID=A0ABU8WMC3_9BURK